MSESIVLSARLEKSKVAANKKQELHLLVGLEGVKLDGERKPLSLVVAIDLSTSMAGRKVEDAKEGLKKLIDHLTDKDTLSIVAFSTSVWTILEATRMTPDAKDRAKTEVSGLHVHSSTNLSGATLEAYEQAKAAAKAGLKDAVGRALLFTDGCPTHGVQEPEKLVEIAKGRPDGTSLICFGYGDDYNADLMKAMVRVAGGDAYHIKTPDEFGPTLGRVLGGLLSCVAQGVKLTLKTKPDVKILEVLNDFDVKGNADQTEAVVTVDDVYSQEKRTVLVRLEIPAMDKMERDFTLGTASIEYQDLVAKEPRSAEVSLKVKYVKEEEADKEADKDVAEKVAIQAAAKAQEEAVRLAKAGHFSQAKGVIRSASLALQDVGTEMARMAASDLDDNVMCNLSPDSFAAGGMHYLHANAGSYSRGRGHTLKAASLFSTKDQKEMENQFGGAPGTIPGPLGGAPGSLPMGGAVSQPTGSAGSGHGPRVKPLPHHVPAPKAPPSLSKKRTRR